MGEGDISAAFISSEVAVVARVRDANSAWTDISGPVKEFVKPPIFPSTSVRRSALLSVPIPFGEHALLNGGSQLLEVTFSSLTGKFDSVTNEYNMLVAGEYIRLKQKELTQLTDNVTKPVIQGWATAGENAIYANVVVKDSPAKVKAMLYQGSNLIAELPAKQFYPGIGPLPGSPSFTFPLVAPGEGYKIRLLEEGAPASRQVSEFVITGTHQADGTTTNGIALIGDLPDPVIESNGDADTDQNAFVKLRLRAKNCTHYTFQVFDILPGGTRKPVNLTPIEGTIPLQLTVAPTENEVSGAIALRDDRDYVVVVRPYRKLGAAPAPVISIPGGEVDTKQFHSLSTKFLNGLKIDFGLTGIDLYATTTVPVDLMVQSQVGAFILQWDGKKETDIPGEYVSKAILPYDDLKRLSERLLAENQSEPILTITATDPRNRAFPQVQRLSLKMTAVSGSIPGAPTSSSNEVKKFLQTVDKVLDVTSKTNRNVESTGKAVSKILKDNTKSLNLKDVLNTGIPIILRLLPLILP